MADPWAGVIGSDPRVAKPPPPRPAPPTRQQAQQERWSDVPSAIIHKTVPTAIDTLWQAAKTIPTADNVHRALTISRMMQGQPVGAGEISNLARQGVSGVNEMLRPLYSWDNLKHALLTNPGGTAMNIGSLLDLGAGAGLSAAEHAGMAGAPITALRAAQGVGRAANLPALTGTAVARGARAAQGAMRGSLGMFDRAGGFTPAGLARAKAVGAKAFPNGEITDAEYADPRFQRTLAQVHQQKGFTPAATREAVLRYNGAPTPRGPIRGAATPAAAEPVTAQLIQRGHQAIDSKVSGIAQNTKNPTPSAQQIRGLANGPQAATIGLTSPEVSDLRLAAAGKDVLDTQGDIAKPDWIGPWGRKLLGGGALVAAQAAIPALHAIPGGPLATELAGAALEDVGERGLHAIQIGQAQRGAPGVGGMLDPVAHAGQAATAVSQGAPAVLAMSPPEKQPGSPGGPPAPAPPPAEQPDIEFGAPEPEAPAAAAPEPAHEGHGDPWAGVAGAAPAPPHQGSTPAPEREQEKDIEFADGGRVEYAAGGVVGDMTEQLLRRAGEAQKAERSATKPLLGLSDATVAQALRVAQRAI